MAGMQELANDPIIAHIRDYGWVYVAAFVLLQFAGAAFLIYLCCNQYRQAQVLKRGACARRRTTIEHPLSIHALSAQVIAAWAPRLEWMTRSVRLHSLASWQATCAGAAAGGMSLSVGSCLDSAGWMQFPRAGGGRLWRGLVRTRGVGGGTLRLPARFDVGYRARQNHASEHVNNCVLVSQISESANLVV
jgi:hypothetical protein